MSSWGEDGDERFALTPEDVKEILSERDAIENLIPDPEGFGVNHGRLCRFELCQDCIRRRFGKG